jgi:serine/threonine-protein kinase
MRFTLLADQSTLAAGSASRTIAISPDGRTIVVAGLAANGSRQLIVRALDDIHPRLLAGSEGANQAFFSPDGKWLGFATALQLKKMPIGGGTPVVLAEIPAGMFGGAWLPNDQIIVATGGLLALVPATGGTPRPFTKLDSASREASQRWPYVLDSKTVLYTSWRASVGTSRVGIASLETGKAVAFDFPGTTPLGLVDGHLIYVGTTGSLMAVAFDMKRLRPSGAPPISLPDQAGVSILGAANAALSPTGSLVYQSESATWQLMLADAHGSVKPLLTERRAFAYPRFSPDGKHVAVAVDAAGRADIWVYSVADGTLSRLTTAGSTNDRPEWSPDSKRVLYRSDRGARSSIWWQPADGSGPEEPLLQMPNVDVWEAVLSPDGRTIVYRTGTTNESDIWYRRLDGDTTPKPIANSRFLEWNARLSSDGRWVAYASMESGNYQVYVRPFPGLGARYQVSAEGGLSPVWSRDGRRLYYTNGPQLVVANLTYTPTFHVTSRSHALDGDFPMVNQGHAGFDVSPTDERVLMLTPVAGNAQMVVAINWLDEVRALLAGKSR